MDETGPSIRQLAACQAILVRAHGRVRAHLWRRWHLWERARNPEIINWALLALWNGITRFPNQALLASYLQGDGRQFCLDTMNEARTTLRFIVAGGVILVAVGVGAFGLLGILPNLAGMLLVGSALTLPIWLVFLALEWIEYRTASYLSVAVDTAIRRLSLAGNTSEEST